LTEGITGWLNIITYIVYLKKIYKKKKKTIDRGITGLLNIITYTYIVYLKL
jgi:hypothetical protein